MQQRFCLSTVNIGTHCALYAVQLETKEVTPDFGQLHYQIYSVPGSLVC